jgi:hypothetical protein
MLPLTMQVTGKADTFTLQWRSGLQFQIAAVLQPHQCCNGCGNWVIAAIQEH